MPKHDDIWLAEDLFKDKNFWSLTVLQKKIVLYTYSKEGDEYSTSDMIRYCCFVNGKRTIRNETFKNAIRKLNGLMFNVDMKSLSESGFSATLKYQNRMKQRDFFRYQKERGIKKDYHLLWEDYCKQTSNPLRIRRDTFTFIFSNILSDLDLNVLLYVLTCYARQTTEENEVSLSYLKELFGYSKSDFTKKIEKSLTYILVNTPNDFLKEWDLRKIKGIRSRVLKIKVR